MLEDSAEKMIKEPEHIETLHQKKHTSPITEEEQKKFGQKKNRKSLGRLSSDESLHNDFYLLSYEEKQRAKNQQGQKNMTV